MFFVSRCSLYISGSLDMADGLSFDVFFCFFFEWCYCYIFVFGLCGAFLAPSTFLLMDEVICAWWGFMLFGLLEDRISVGQSLF